MNSQKGDVQGGNATLWKDCDERIVQRAINAAGSDLSIDEKKDSFAALFEACTDPACPPRTEAIVNIWATAAMLEDDIGVPRKVIAVRGFIQSGEVTPDEIGEWARKVYSLKKAPEDMLSFLAVDIRNHPGIPDDVKRMLAGY